MSATCPIWLVVGFLGAGKTTLLQRLAKTTRGRSLVYVVNEFSAVDVDACLIEREGGKTIAVPGGSIFCRSLIAEFVNVLHQVSEGRVNNADPAFRPEGVVIEACGIADPRSMRRLLAESRLDALYHVAGVIAVVDPGTLMKLLLVLPNIRGQIESADLILLNKMDLHAPATIEKVRSKISAMNPRATLIRCRCGEVDPAIILADGVSQRADQVDAAFGACKDPRFEREAVVFQHPVDLQALCDCVTGAGEGLYRAKGFVNATCGWKYLDWGSGVLSLEESDPGHTSALALIWNPRTVSGSLAKRISLCGAVPPGGT
ncbi:MAG: GTP-binding protein [bacterium]